MKLVLSIILSFMVCNNLAQAQIATSSEFAPLLRTIYFGPLVADTSFTTAFGMAIRFNKANNQVDSLYLLCPPGYPCDSLSTQITIALQKTANTSNIDWKQQARPFAIKKVTFVLPVLVRAIGANPNDFSAATSIFWNHIWMPLYVNKPWPPPGLVLLAPEFLFCKPFKQQALF